MAEGSGERDWRGLYASGYAHTMGRPGEEEPGEQKRRINCRSRRRRRSRCDLRGLICGPRIYITVGHTHAYACLNVSFSFSFSFPISISLFRSFPLGIRDGDCEDDVTVLRLLLVADNGNKPRKGEGTWKKEDTYVQRRKRDGKIKREEERERENRRRGESTGKRNEERKQE